MSDFHAVSLKRLLTHGIGGVPPHVPVLQLPSPTPSETKNSALYHLESSPDPTKLYFMLLFYYSLPPLCRTSLFVFVSSKNVLSVTGKVSVYSVMYVERMHVKGHSIVKFQKLFGKQCQ